MEMLTRADPRPDDTEVLFWVFGEHWSRQLIARTPEGTLQFRTRRLEEDLDSDTGAWNPAGMLRWWLSLTETPQNKVSAPCA